MSKDQIGYHMTHNMHVLIFYSIQQNTFIHNHKVFRYFHETYNLQDIILRKDLLYSITFMLILLLIIINYNKNSL